MEKKDGSSQQPPIGSPLDGGASPADNLNNYNPNPSRPLEVGLIMGVIVVVGLSVVLLFWCRARKNKQLEERPQKDDFEAGVAAGSPTGDELHHQHHIIGDIHHGNPMHEREGRIGDPPVPPPKDSRRRGSDDSDVIHNTSGITIERRAEDAPRTPTWSAWGNRHGGYNGVEEHEIVNRV
ncbi:hypothetical protein PG985_010767 [Apiospora marii]|uniref:Uncharacterized protein n=1 Tax=Apiospora marii TaxID=335849 RepID=A0ABR1T1W9_9PEZI